MPLREQRGEGRSHQVTVLETGIACSLFLQNAGGPFRGTRNFLSSPSIEARSPTAMLTRLGRVRLSPGESSGAFSEDPRAFLARRGDTCPRSSAGHMRLIHLLGVKATPIPSKRLRSRCCPGGSDWAHFSARSRASKTLWPEELSKWNESSSQDRREGRIEPQFLASPLHISQ